MKARAETILRDRLELGPVLGLQPRRLAVLVASVSLSVFLALTVWTFSMALEAYQRRSDAAMVELALALASQVDIDAHERLVSDGQTGSEEYKRLLAPLEQMHLEMHEVRGVYTKRIDAGGDMVYVLDTAQSDIPVLRDRATAVTRVGERVLTDTIEPGLVPSVLAGTPWLDSESFVEGGIRLRGIYVPLRAASGAVVGMLGIDFGDGESRAVARRWGVALALPAAALLGVVAGLLGCLVWFMRHELGLVLSALREETVRDPVTGLFNRRHFTQSLSGHVDLAQRTGRTLSLLVIDIDRFKSINDALGHVAGDRVLVTVAEALQHCARSEDIVCRIGGEEFALVLPGTDVLQARVLFDRIAAATRRPLDERGDIGLRLTVSAGIAALLANEDADGLMLRADRALYGAKRDGRDRCETAPGHGPA